MKSNIALIVVGGLLLAVVAVIAWLLARFELGGIYPWDLFLGSSIVMKLCIILAVGGGLAGIIGALTRVGPLVWIGAGAAVLFGILGGLYGEMTTQAALAYVGSPVGLEVTAPSRIESLASVGCGLVMAFIALAIRRLRPR